MLLPSVGQMRLPRPLETMDLLMGAAAPTGVPTLSVEPWSVTGSGKMGTIGDSCLEFPAVTQHRRMEPRVRHPPSGSVGGVMCRAPCPHLTSYPYQLGSPLISQPPRPHAEHRARSIPTTRCPGTSPPGGCRLLPHGVFSAKRWTRSLQSLCS